MMQSTKYKLLEFFIIFVVVPVSFALAFSAWIKLAIGFLGFVYVVFVLLKIERNKFKISKKLNWKQFWQRTLLKLFGIVLITTIYVFIFDSNNLFVMPINKPLVWLVILFIYSVFSVYPQELIFRTFFFQRYQSLFKNKTLFTLVNAILFSLAHIFLEMLW